MYFLNDMLELETNYAIGAVVGLLTAAVAVAMVIFAVKFKEKKLSWQTFTFAAVTFICTVVSSAFCYNELVLVGYLVSILSLTAVMSIICQMYHRNTIYNISFRNLYIRMLLPISVIGLMFRPWFTEAEGARNTWMPGLGMNTNGTYVYDVIVLSGNAQNPVKWNIISIVEILLFLMVLIMQVVLIWREFADPDNANSWAFIGTFVTALGAAFIFGVYTSPNFNIATTMKLSTVRKYDMATGTLLTYEEYKPISSNTDNVTIIPLVIILIGVLTWLVHFESVEKFIDNIENLPKTISQRRKAKKAAKIKA